MQEDYVIQARAEIQTLVKRQINELVDYADINNLEPSWVLQTFGNAFMYAIKEQSK